MIVNYTLQKMREMQAKCKSMQKCIQFIEEIQHQEVLDNCRDCHESLIFPFVKDENTSDGEIGRAHV